MIKLAPTGKKHQRHYRIVLTEKKKKLTGSHQAILGHYHPLLAKTNPDRLVVDQAKVTHWISQGAQVTDRIRKLVHV